MKSIRFSLVAGLLTFGLVACDGTMDGGSDPVCNYDTCKVGPYAQTTQSLTSGPSGDSGVWYPTNIKSISGTLPIFLWGCGGGTNPDSYPDHMSRIASHGFVVVAETSSGNGTELVDALAWLKSENSRSGSVFYKKLDLNRVAAGGHSMGSITTFAFAATKPAGLVTTIQVAGGTLDGNGTGATKLTKPVMYVTGSEDQMGATPNAEVDYEKTKVPTFYVEMQGVDHIGAARQGLPGMIAWLRWHLMGETERKAEFLQPNRWFTGGSSSLDVGDLDVWESKSKNW